MMFSTHREVVGEHEVLMHHADAGGDRIGRRLEVGLVPEHGDGALVGLMHAVQRLHQRRLARTVLADDGVDRARPDSQGDVVVGDDAREASCRSRPVRPRSCRPSCWYNTRARGAIAPGSCSINVR